MAYGAKDISILKGLQPVRERPGMYIGSTGPVGTSPPRLRGRRQLRRRGAGRLRDAYRRHPAARRRLSRHRRRPRHPGRSAPRVSRQVGRGDRAHDAARGRQVRGRGLQDLRRPARRRGLGGERAARAASRWRSDRDGGRYSMVFVDGGEPVAGLQRIGDSDEHGTSITFWPDPHDHGGGRVPRADAGRAAAGDGVPEQGPRDRLPRRARRRADRADLQVRRAASSTS